MQVVRDPGGGGGVGEGAVAVVVVQPVCGGGRVGHEQVEGAVAVEISPGGATSVGGVGDVGVGRPFRERAVPVVPVEAVRTGHDDHVEVGIPVVVVVAPAHA